MLRLINFSSHCLLNYEETVLIVVQHKVCKVTSHKGKRRISPSSVERGSLVTTVTCMNAAVTEVPPLLLFLGAK
jgi:predicted SprT family Zn-dependent metalloprotease